MKYLYIGLVILLASCATRPDVPVTANVPEQTESGIPHELLTDFERAFLSVSENSPLVTKFIDPVPAGAAAHITVMGECIIGGNQFQVSYDLSNPALTDNYRITFYVNDPASGMSRTGELLWNPSQDSPPDDHTGLLLSFDDSYLRSWLNGLDLFDKYGAQVTFFVQGSIDNADTQVGVSLKDFCHEAVRRGHSLGFHSVSHYDLTRVSRSMFHRETTEAAEVFLADGIPLSAFAFPFGFSELWMRGDLASVFPVTRGFGSNIRFYSANTPHNNYIISKSIDNIVYPDDSVFEREILLILLAAKFTGNTIVPFTTHDIADAAQWGIKPGRLEYLLKTARDLRIRFYTYAAIQG